MKLKAVIWVVILALLWGPAFLFMKVAVQEIPPLTIAATRVTLGAAVLYLILRWQGQSLPKFGPVWRHFAVMGLAANAVPFSLLSWGQQYIDSALAAILVGTLPLFTIFLAHFFTVDDKLSPKKVAGMLVGFSGLVILFIPALFDGIYVTVWGCVAAISAALSYAAAFVYARQRLRGLPPLVAPTAQLAASTFCLLPFALIVERPYTLSLPSWPVVGALLLLAFWSTVLAFVVYYRAMEQINASTVSVATYLNPLVATVLGSIVLHEQISWNVYLGYTLILLSALTIWRFGDKQEVVLSNTWKRSVVSSDIMDKRCVRTATTLDP